MIERDRMTKWRRETEISKSEYETDTTSDEEKTGHIQWRREYTQEEVKRVQTQEEEKRVKTQEVVMLSRHNKCRFNTISSLYHTVVHTANCVEAKQRVRAPQSCQAWKIVHIPKYSEFSYVVQPV